MAVRQKCLCFFAFWVLLLGASALAQQPSPLPPAPARPDSAGPTSVNFTVWLADVTGINSVEQTFSANFVMIARWKDSRLSHAGPGTKQYSIDDVWHPRILIANETGESSRSLPEVVDVTPDGMVIYRQRIIGTFAQSLNLRAFPFDRSSLHIQLVALGCTPDELKFLPDARAITAGLTNGIGISDAMTIPDWSIDSATTRLTPFRVTPGVELAGLSIECMATRRSLHFVAKVIIPLILIVAMSWAVFWIDTRDASTRMAIAVTAMLTLIAYRFAIDSQVPELPYLTRLDSFVLGSSILVFLSIIEVVVVTKFAVRENQAIAVMIDRKSRWIFPLVFCVFASVILSM